MPDEKPTSRSKRLEARVTPETLRQVDELRQMWGVVKPLSRADVAEVAIERAWKAEKAKEKR